MRPAPAKCLDYVQIPVHLPPDELLAHQANANDRGGKQDIGGWLRGRGDGREIQLDIAQIAGGQIGAVIRYVPTGRQSDVQSTEGSANRAVRIGYQYIRGIRQRTETK